MYSLGRTPGAVWLHLTGAPLQPPRPQAQAEVLSLLHLLPESVNLAIEVSASEERYINGLSLNLGALVSVANENSSKEAASCCEQIPWKESVSADTTT